MSTKLLLIIMLGTRFHIILIQSILMQLIEISLFLKKFWSTWRFKRFLNEYV